MEGNFLPAYNVLTQEMEGKIPAYWRSVPMSQQRRQHEGVCSPVCAMRFSDASASHLLSAFACLFLLGVVSCGQIMPKTSSNASASSPSLHSTFPRNHVSPNEFWHLVYASFTPSTTYLQASTVLSKTGVSAYPITSPPCGDLREMGAPIPASSPAPAPTPMSPEELRADFQRSHHLLVQTDSWEKLNQLATAPTIISVDPFPLPKTCPAQAPIS